MRSTNKTLSALPALKPVIVWDAITGEEVVDWHTAVDLLLGFVKSESELLYREHKNSLCEALSSWSGSPQPAEFARKNNWNINTTLAREVKAKSRVERLVRYNLVTTAASYYLNPLPGVQEPNFPRTINLGAIDRQMASLSLENYTLSLLWKVWDKELLFEFELPSYVFTTRKITKWCLPVVRYSQKTGDLVFNFSYEEPFKSNPVNKLKAGVDLGRRVVYTATVINEKEKLVAQYYPSGRLTQLNNKRERLLLEKKQIKNKLKALQQLNTLPLKQNRLELESKRLTNKITQLGIELSHQLGFEVSKKLEKHALHVVNIENLKWVTGAKYGSRWNHSRQQEALTHALRRKGVATRKVNPKNTSQSCHLCKTPITHSTKTRTVHCATCKTTFDRDYNAALNITKNKTYPANKRLNGDEASALPHFIAEKHKSDSQELLTIVRITT